MKKVVVQSFLATIVALLVAAFIAFSGSQGGVEFHGIPVFALCAGLAILIQWIVFIPSMINIHLYIPIEIILIINNKIKINP